MSAMDVVIRLFSLRKISLVWMIVLYTMCLHMTQLQADQKQFNDLLMAKTIIATRLEVSINSIHDHKSLADIGIGADQYDVINILAMLESTYSRVILDRHVRQAFGRFDRGQANRITAAKLAKLITVLKTSE